MLTVRLHPEPVDQTIDTKLARSQNHPVTRWRGRRLHLEWDATVVRPQDRARSEVFSEMWWSNR